eukprot:CAMPEP_0117070186 /NCGR_PEP_ID=MMETSP0472-20121206/49317_1 /TAXON_ID=693140 ORGANISM="Tiarina fusus, Strain LIS" /NCGR_SAMPLE_ID=MMETSP0472 /ASSEMBLY_ACC=CAM_ASM_000603 /LENGTH=304 /DNA_ID=CAMNT_0004793205 /DNA_START=18 /DNA_END=932 /DNA_ORIENTATION=+
MRYGTIESTPTLRRTRQKNQVVVLAGFVLVTASALVLLATTSQPFELVGTGATTASTAVNAQDNLAQSGALLKRVESLIAQEKQISSAVSKIEMAGAPAPASASAGATAAAPAAAASAGAAAPVAAGSVASGSAAAGGSAAAAGSAASGSAASGSAASADEDEGEVHSTGRVRHHHHWKTAVKTYTGRVGGTMSGEGPEEKKTVLTLNETKRARLVLMGAVFIAFCLGSIWAVHTYRKGNGGLVENVSYVQDGKIGSSSFDSRSAQEKLAEVQRAQVAARKQLAEQQEQLSAAQAQLRSQRGDA